LQNNTTLYKTELQIYFIYVIYWGLGLAPLFYPMTKSE